MRVWVIMTGKSLYPMSCNGGKASFSKRERAEKAIGHIRKHDAAYLATRPKLRPAPVVASKDTLEALGLALGSY